MTSLNLPPFDVRLKGTKQAPLIFDFLRRRYVRLTPEEWVRQHFVHFMVEHRHYPASLLANEVSLHVGDKAIRSLNTRLLTYLSRRLFSTKLSPTICCCM